MFAGSCAGENAGEFQPILKAEKAGYIALQAVSLDVLAELQVPSCAAADCSAQCFMRARCGVALFDRFACRCTLGAAPLNGSARSTEHAHGTTMCLLGEEDAFVALGLLRGESSHGGGPCASASRCFKRRHNRRNLASSMSPRRGGVLACMHASNQLMGAMLFCIDAQCRLHIHPHTAWELTYPWCPIML